VHSNQLRRVSCSRAACSNLESDCDSSDTGLN
jgi:hypothetical protein